MKQRKRLKVRGPDGFRLGGRTKDCYVLQGQYVITTRSWDTTLSAILDTRLRASIVEPLRHDALSVSALPRSQ